RSASSLKILALDASLFFMRGQCEGELAAFARNAAASHPDSSVMHLYQLFDDGKDQSSYRGCEHQRMFATIETLEHTILVFKRNANAVVLHINLQFTSTIQGLNLNLNGAILGRVMIGVK